MRPPGSQKPVVGKTVSQKLTLYKNFDKITGPHFWSLSTESMHLGKANLRMFALRQKVRAQTTILCRSPNFNFNFSDSHLAIDTCCNKETEKQFDPKITSSNNLQQINCNGIKPKYFYQEYALSGKPVLLDDCSMICTSRTWNLEELAKDFSEVNGGATWYDL